MELRIEGVKFLVTSTNNRKNNFDENNMLKSDWKQKERENDKKIKSTFNKT